MTNKISPVTFQGLKIEGVVSAKNIKKLGEFTNATENLRFLEDLEKELNTDLVLNGTLDKISFSHNIYGDLTKYNCPQFPAKDFFSKVVDAMSSIKLAIKKAEEAFQAEKLKYDSTRRGC